MKTFRLLTALTLGTLLWGCAESGKKAEGPFYTDIESRAQLHDWFRYAPERPIVVSGHPGGRSARGVLRMLYHTTVVGGRTSGGMQKICAGKLQFTGFVHSRRRALRIPRP